MLPEGVLSISIRADFCSPRKTKEKRNWSSIDISVLSSTEWTYRYQKSCIKPCHGHFTAMSKGQKCVLLLLSLHHFLYPHNFQGTIAGTDITHTAARKLVKKLKMCKNWVGRRCIRSVCGEFRSLLVFGIVEDIRSNKICRFWMRCSR